MACIRFVVDQSAQAEKSHVAGGDTGEPKEAMRKSPRAQHGAQPRARRIRRRPPNECREVRWPGPATRPDGHLGEPIATRHISRAGLTDADEGASWRPREFSPWHDVR